VAPPKGAAAQVLPVAAMVGLLLSSHAVAADAIYDVRAEYYDEEIM